MTRQFYILPRPSKTELKLIMAALKEPPAYNVNVHTHEMPNLHFVMTVFNDSPLEASEGVVGRRVPESGGRWQAAESS